MIIDVSHNNGFISWDKVKPHISKAILRVGYGDDAISQDDKQFLRNLSECKRLGIPVDFYIYSYAKTVEEARSEAKHALRLAKSGIIYYDSEEPGTGFAARACAETFRDAIKDAGRQVGLYCSESWYQSYLNGIKGFDSLWIAKYGRNDGQQGTKPSIECNLWQYTSRALLSGIDGFVDANVDLLPTSKTGGSTAPRDVINGVYRLYNPNSGEHFYTKSVKERDNTLSAGWKYEGVAWKAPKASLLRPKVYRLMNKKNGYHFYTASKSEKKRLMALGWKSEGTAFYSDAKRRTPIYRLYDTKGGHHFFTSNKKERKKLIKSGWMDEGVAFYGC